MNSPESAINQYYNNKIELLKLIQNIDKCNFEDKNCYQNIAIQLSKKLKTQAIYIKKEFGINSYECINCIKNK
ncbi:MAG: hypothetical protein LBV11_22100 [Bacillus cereus]|jgi:hypothetical protein|nr:hypothetical protein [Bacillus cereus]